MPAGDATRPGRYNTDVGGSSDTRTTSDADDFSEAIVAVTSAFGDNTRRRIYLFVRQRGDGVTATEVAQEFELHPNVARHHLDKLAASSYLDTDTSVRGAVGRPSKRYRVSDEVMALPFPTRRDDLLITLLGQALAMLGPDQAELLAEQVGEQYGSSLADQLSPEANREQSIRAALHTVAEALTSHGFAAHAEERGSSVADMTKYCPMGDVAPSQHPVVRAVDRGMVRGMLATLYGEETPVTISTRARGSEYAAGA